MSFTRSKHIAGDKFETYLEKANSAQTKEDLFAVFSDTVRKHGLDRVMLCLVTDHRDIGETAGMKFMHNYPDDWMSYYLEKELNYIDPVIIHGHKSIESFEWKSLFKKMHMTKEQQHCLNMGIEAGLNNGVCTPLRGPNNAIGGLSLASTERHDSFDGNVDLINAYSNHFYIAYRRLGANQSFSKLSTEENFALTSKEREILKWTGLGKSAPEIGIILNISVDTVNFHFRNIFKKLDVNSKILAVIKASILGLIEPPKI